MRSGGLNEILKILR